MPPATTPSARRQPEKNIFTASAEIPPFDAVRTCVPFNVLVAKGDANRVTVAAEEEVVNATRVQVAGTLVILSLAHGFTSVSPINVTVTSAEATALRSVQNSGSGTLVVGPGFALPDLEVASSGIGGVQVHGAAVQSLQVLASGCGAL